MVGAKGVPATFGGVERVVEEVGARLATRGWRVIVTSRGAYTGQADLSPHDHRGMTVVPAPWHLRRKGFDTLSAAAAALMRVLVSSRWRPDLVHFHGLGVAPLALLARWAGAKVVTQVHGLEWRNAQWSGLVRRYFRWCEVPATRWSDVAMSGGQADADGLMDRQRRPVVAIPNGVDVPTEGQLVAWRDQPAPADFAAFADTPFVLSVGRLVPEKGPQHLIDGFVRACSRNRDPLDSRTQLVIVGDSPGREDFVASLRDSVPTSLAPRVHFVGFRYGDELEWLWTHARLFVLPSETEGLSLTLLEAMARRVPIVVSDIRQNTDVTLDLAASFATRDPDDLATVLQRELASPPGAARLQAARQRVETAFSWDHVTDCVEAIYRRALGEPGRGQH